MAVWSRVRLPPGLLPASSRRATGGGPPRSRPARRPPTRLATRAAGHGWPPPAAPLAHQPRQPRPSAPSTRHTGRRRRPCHGPRSIGRRPGPRRTRRAYAAGPGPRAAADQGDGHVLDGAGGGLGGGRGDVHGAVPRQDHARRAGSLGAAQDRTEVARVGHRRGRRGTAGPSRPGRPPGRRDRPRAAGRRGRRRPGAPRGQGVEPPGPLADGHRRPAASSGCRRGRGGIAVVDEQDLAHLAPPGDEQLPHGLAPLDLLAARPDRAAARRRTGRGCGW